MDELSDHHAVQKGQLQDSAAAAAVPASDDRALIGKRVTCDLPSYIPVDREEIAILRAFLSDDIRAIIEGDELPVEK
jgi:hypothetical protein